MHYSTLFFDLDDTLYASGNGLWDAIGVRMNQYMAERLDLPQDDIPALRRKYYETYGTTLRGLQTHFQVEPDDYLSYVHDLPLREYLQPAPELQAMLMSLSQQRWIFTNADRDHAARVIDALGLVGCFTGIIDVRAIQFACKPELIAYQRALVHAGNPHPSQCVLLDDSVVNLAAARQLGFTTILVGHEGNAHPAVNYTLSHLIRLPEVMPQLWQAKSAG